MGVVESGVSEHTDHSVPAQVADAPSDRVFRAQIIEAGDEPIYGELPSVEAGLVAALLLVLAVAAFIPFIPVLFNGWVLQDDVNVRANTFVQSWAGLKYIWRLPHHFPQFSPLGYTLFLLETFQFKANPAGFHAVNLVLHLLNVVLLWTLLRKLELPGAWIATLLFAVHPVTVESVAWISRQPTLLGTCFLLGSLIVYSRYCGLNPRPDELTRFFRLPERPALVYALATVLFILAVLAYPLAAVFPLIVLVLIWWEAREIRMSDIKPLLPHLVVTLAVLVAAIVIQVRFGASTENALASRIELSPLDRLVIAGRALWFYLVKIVFPFKLAFAYPTWKVGTLWPLIFVTLALAAAGALIAFRRRLPRGAFAGVLLFLITVLPVVTILDPVALRRSFVADQLIYLGSMAVLVPLASLLAERFIPRFFVPNSVRPGPWVAIVVVLVLGALTMKLSLEYRDQETLWANTIDKYPDTVIAHDGLGMMALNATPPNISKAAEHFRKALNVDNRDLVAMLNLGQAYAQMNDWDRAIGQFKMAQAARPDSGQVHAALAELYLRRGYSEPAVDEYEAALQLEPRNDEFMIGLGRVYEKRGEPDKAIELYRRAVKVNPRSVFGHNYLAVLLYYKGRALELAKKTDEAKAIYEEVAKELQIVNSIDSSYFPVYMSSGAILVNLGALPKAEIAFRNAVYLQPSNVEARTSLAMVQIRMRKDQDAKLNLTAALNLDPNSRRAHYFLGVILSHEKDVNGALEHLRKAVDLDAQQHDGAVDPLFLKTYRELADQRRS